MATLKSYFKKKNRIELIVLSILSVLITFMLFSVLNGWNSLSWCKFKFGVSKDECIANAAYEAKNDSFCELISDPFIKDICYLDLASFEISEDFWSPFNPLGFGFRYNCNKINNNFLLNMCFRLPPRPHMAKFLLNRSAKAGSSLDICSIYSGHNRLVCNYVYTADYAKLDLEKSKKICNQIDSIKSMGECYFYIEMSLSVYLEEHAEETIDFLMDFCTQIDYPEWKSECYFYLADELAIQKSKLFGKMAEACRESTKYRDFSCYHHLTFNLDDDSRKAFCSAVEGDYFKLKCYLGLGFNLVKESYSIDKGLSYCDTAEDGFKEMCKKSFAAIWGEFSVNHNNDVKEANFGCLKFPEKYRQSCFIGLGNYFSLKNNVSGIIAGAGDIDPANTKDYLAGVAHGLFTLYKRDLPQIKDALADIPQNFKKEIFHNLGGAMSVTSVRNSTEAKEICKSIAGNFSDTCIEGIEEKDKFIFYSVVFLH